MNELMTSATPIIAPMVYTQLFTVSHAPRSVPVTPRPNRPTTPQQMRKKTPTMRI